MSCMCLFVIVLGAGHSQDGAVVGDAVAPGLSQYSGSLSWKHTCNLQLCVLCAGARTTYSDSAPGDFTSYWHESFTSLHCMFWTGSVGGFDVHMAYGSFIKWRHVHSRCMTLAVVVAQGPQDLALQLPNFLWQFWMMLHREPAWCLFQVSHHLLQWHSTTPDP